MCRVWEIPRSTIYARHIQERRTEPLQKRGPKTSWTDDELTNRVKETIVASPFVGEGYRKVWARLRFNGIRTSKERVLRLMREAQLLAPTRPGNAHGPKAHDRTIIPEGPDMMWGTDATSTLTKQGTATIFIAVDHYTEECVGIHAALRGTRFEALEPVRQGLREHFGSYSAGCAVGLKLRHDHGSQYMSDHFQRDIRFAGIESSPAFVREPEGNGCVERFNKTIKEQLLWLNYYATLEELQEALRAFKDLYNSQWICGRHKYLTPTQARIAGQQAKVA